jgi:hypothetical protein
MSCLAYSHDLATSERSSACDITDPDNSLGCYIQVLLFQRSLLPPSSGFSGGIGLQNVGTCVPITHGVKSLKT